MRPLFFRHKMCAIFSKNLMCAQKQNFLKCNVKWSISGYRFFLLPNNLFMEHTKTMPLYDQKKI